MSKLKHLKLATKHFFKSIFGTLLDSEGIKSFIKVMMISIGMILTAWFLILGIGSVILLIAIATLASGSMSDDFTFHNVAECSNVIIVYFLFSGLFISGIYLLAKGIFDIWKHSWEATSARAMARKLMG